jgi:hypothetical protein
MRPLSDDNILLIRARCPELAGVDFEEFSRPAPEGISAEIAFEERLDQLEKIYALTKPRG